MSSPSVVFSLRFVQAKDAKSNYSSYSVGYLSRPEAFKQNELHENDLIYHDLNPKYDQYAYMSDKDKTDGLFDASEDTVSDYHKYLYKKIFDESQNNDCPLYQGVISFKNSFLKDNGIDYNSPDGFAKLKEIARPAIAAMIHESMLVDKNVVWTAAIHHNTDNIHIHVAIVEKEKISRRFDRLDEKAFEKLKSRVANNIVSNERIEDLKTISQILNTDIPKWIGNETTSAAKQIEILKNTIPPEITWEYNRKEMAQYHTIIDDCVNTIIASDTEITARYEDALKAMNRCEKLYHELYGGGESGRIKEWTQKHLRDFYSRAGNALLREAKIFAESENRARPAGEKSTELLGSILPNFTDEDAVPENDNVLPPDNFVFPKDNIKSSVEVLTELYESAVKNDGSENYEQYRQGMDCLKGKNAPKDEQRALMLFMVSGDSGNPYAAYAAAKMFDSGIGTEKNILAADKYFYKAYTAFLHYDTGQLSENCKVLYQLGKMTERGEGTPNDIIKAVGYYERAAELGSLNAQLRLGYIYKNGACDINGGEIHQDIEKAKNYYYAALQNDNPKAAYELGKIYRSENDIKGAKQCFDYSFMQERKALEQGICFAKRTNEYREARNYLYGINGVKKDEKQAFKYMKAQAYAGNVYALYDLAGMYRDGIGTETDKSVSDKFYSEALKAFITVENNNPDAFIEYRLGSMYETGKGTKKGLFSSRKILQEFCLQGKSICNVRAWAAVF